MATPNSTKQSEMDLRQVVETRARQLRALLDNTYGESGDAFRRMNDDRQDEYLWACADMAEEIVKSLESLAELRIAKQGQRNEVAA